MTGRRRTTEEDLALLRLLVQTMRWNARGMAEAAEFCSAGSPAEYNRLLYANGQNRISQALENLIEDHGEFPV